VKWRLVKLVGARKLDEKELSVPQSVVKVLAE